MADFSWIKEHPYESGAIVVGGAILLYIVYEAFSGSSSTATASTTTATPQGYVSAPDDTALGINAQLDEAQLTASTNEQLSSDATNLGITQANDSLSLGTVQANDALSAVQANDTTQGNIYSGYYATAISLAQIAAQTPTTAVSAPGNQQTVINNPVAYDPTNATVNPTPVSTSNPTVNPTGTSSGVGLNGDTGSTYSYYPSSQLAGPQTTDQFGGSYGEVLINPEEPSEGYTYAYTGGPNALLGNGQ